MNHQPEITGPPFPRLPSGSSRLSPEAVERDQRRRIVASTARALAERGYAEMTVSDITGYAGVSRATFYKFFSNKQDCVVRAYQAIFDRFLARLTRACEHHSDWNSRIAAAIADSLSFMAEQPDEARILTLDCHTGDLELAEQILSARHRLAAMLSPAREQLANGEPPPQITELALVSAIFGVASDRLATGEAERLRELAPQFLWLALLPYLGAEDASRLSVVQVIESR